MSGESQDSHTLYTHNVINMYNYFIVCKIFPSFLLRSDKLLDRHTRTPYTTSILLNTVSLYTKTKNTLFMGLVNIKHHILYFQRICLSKL